MKGQREESRLPGLAKAALVLVFAFLWLSSAATAQFIQNTTRNDGSDLIRNPAHSHYNVVALRVEFQPDSTDFTTGDGTFSGILFDGVDAPSIDPLPHDTEYFQAHLTFLENYVRRVSDGRTSIASFLIPEVVRVSKQMGAYAPIGFESSSDGELSKLASLAEEAWTRVSELDSFDLPSGIDPEHTAFVLFHAGVGRDVELLGTTLDKTPEDLPSLFFDSEALERLLGSFDVRVDGLQVTNSLVIPRTESRRGMDFFQDKPFVAEFSINGMLAASFLSYLGVPDLFDTETGESAIGPFGVMDGLGIFAYSGLLPPEPSAWTKTFLGWSDLKFPDNDGDELVTLTHAGSPIANEAFLASVGDGEFFLVENRNRDPEGDGLNLTVWSDGSIQNIHFDTPSDDFNSFTTRGFPGGVVLDADNLDSSLPGGEDSNGTLLEGGILVWHVDERRLLEGLASNAVNVGALTRAVDLEEADGAQDIGFPNESAFGPSFHVGSPFDFYYLDNPATVVTPSGNEIRLYENRFGPDTYPNSASNAGGSSFVELSGFSAPGPEMSFSYRHVAEAGIEFRGDIGFSFEEAEEVFADGGSLHWVGGGGVDFAAFGIDSDNRGRLMWSLAGETVGTLGNLYHAPPAQFNSKIVVLGSQAFWELNPDGTTQVAAALPGGLDIVRTTTPVVASADGTYLVGAVSRNGPILLSAQYGQVSVENLPQELLSLAMVDRVRKAYVFSDQAEIPSLDLLWEFGANIGNQQIQAFFARIGRFGDSNPGSIIGIVPDPLRDRLILLTEDGSTRHIDVGLHRESGSTGPMSSFPVIAQLNRYRAEILLTIGKTLIAYNWNGAVVDGFPIPLRQETDVQPLAVRLVGEESPVIFVAAIDGRIDAYDVGARNHLVPGFPLTAGTGLSAAPLFQDGSLMAISQQGTVAQWDLPDVDRIIWGVALGEANRSFAEITAGSESIGNGFIDTEVGLLKNGETYNWPNPIREDATWIRFQLRERSNVEITIVDMSGRLVDSLEYLGAPGGLSTEIQWRPTVGSGVYMARVRATSVDGETDTHLIKMAVIR